MPQEIFQIVNDLLESPCTCPDGHPRGVTQILLWIIYLISGCKVLQCLVLELVQHYVKRNFCGSSWGCNTDSTIRSYQAFSCSLLESIEVFLVLASKQYLHHAKFGLCSFTFFSKMSCRFMYQQSTSSVQYTVLQY